jgi:uncharacterized SAM-binding protein YcdF (DUF218 family)
VLGIVAALACAGELAAWLASSRPPAPPPGTDCAVLVLGYPTRADGEPDAVQRARVATGVAALRRYGCDRLVLSGGAAHNAFVEADAMGRIAEQLGVGAGQIALEQRAKDTWENVAFSLPLLADRGAIFVASEGMHARRGVRYVCRQRPDLCARTRAVADYVPIERIGWNAGAALYELWTWLRDRSARP